MAKRPAARLFACVSIDNVWFRVFEPIEVMSVMEDTVNSAYRRYAFHARELLVSCKPDMFTARGSREFRNSGDGGLFFALVDISGKQVPGLMNRG